MRDCGLESLSTSFSWKRETLTKRRNSLRLILTSRRVYIVLVFSFDLPMETFLSSGKAHTVAIFHHGVAFCKRTRATVYISCVLPTIIASRHTRVNFTATAGLTGTRFRLKLSLQSSMD